MQGDSGGKGSKSLVQIWPAIYTGLRYKYIQTRAFLLLLLHLRAHDEEQCPSTYAFCIATSDSTLLVIRSTFEIHFVAKSWLCWRGCSWFAVVVSCQASSSTPPHLTFFLSLKRRPNTQLISPVFLLYTLVFLTKTVSATVTYQSSAFARLHPSSTRLTAVRVEGQFFTRHSHPPHRTATLSVASAENRAVGYSHSGIPVS